MKKYTFLLLTIVLLSCSAKKVDKKFVSDDQEVSLTISATQSVAFDPFVTSVLVEGYGHRETLSFEVYNNNFSSDDITMTWSSNQEGILRIKQSDGNNRVLKLLINKDRVMLRE